MRETEVQVVMRQPIRWLSVFFGMVAMCAAENLLPNGDFSGGWRPNVGSDDTARAEGVMPDDWEDVSTWSGASTRYERIAGSFGAGTGVRMSLTATSRPGSKIQLRSQHPLHMRQGHCYRVSLAVRTPPDADTAAGRPGDFLDNLVDGDERLFAQVAIRQHQPPHLVFWATWLPVTREWRRHEFIAQPGESGDARFFVSFSSVGTLDVAKLMVEDAGPAPVNASPAPVPLRMVRSVRTRGPTLRHSDICTQYTDSPEILRKYLVDVVTWGSGVRFEPAAIEKTREHIRAAREAGVRLHAINCTLVQEGGRCIVGAGQHGEETAKRFWALRKDNEGQISSLTAMGIDLHRNAVLDVHGDWVPVPWLRRRWRIPMASVYAPAVRKWYLDMADAAGRTGANALHFDEPAMGAYGLLNPSPGDFSDSAMAAFREWLAARPDTVWKQAGIESLEAFNYRDYVLAHGGDPRQTALWREFVRFQLATVTDFVAELRDRVRAAAGNHLPFSANANPSTWIKLPFIGLMDFMSSEIGHEARRCRVPTEPVLAYKFGDAFRQPVVTMAQGSEWYLMKKDQRPMLISTWIALGYALGHHFIIPHKAWVMDPVKGSQTYRPTTDHFACMSRFIKAVAPLLDDYAPLSTTAVVIGCDAVEHDRAALNALAGRLCDANVPFHVVIEGNDLLPRQVSDDDLAGASTVIVASPPFLSEASRGRIAAVTGKRPLALYGGGPLPPETPRPIRVSGATGIWVLPRRRPDDESAPAVLHLLNRDYDAKARRMTPKGPFTVELEAALFGGLTFTDGTLHQPTLFAKLPEDPAACHQATPVTVTQTGGTIRVTVPALDLWGVLELRR